MKGEAACAGGWRDVSVMIAGRMPGNHSINKNVQGHEYELNKLIPTFKKGPSYDQKPVVCSAFFSSA